MTSPQTIRFDRRPLPAWSVSVLLHAALVVLLGFFLQRVPKGAGEEPGRTVGIVLRHMADDREWFEGEDDQPQDGESSQTIASTTEDILNALPEASATTASALSGLPFVGPGGTETDAVGSAGDMTQGGGGGARAQPGGAARVRVFGAEGVGDSFLYLFDRSVSMEGGPLNAAKKELIQSLQSLDSTHQFHILFFNDQVTVWDLTGGQNRVAYANDQSKELAARYVRGIAAYGGTDRLTALLKALGFRPDVIFFLTDADDGMPVYEIDRVTARNAGRTAIICIEFGRGAARGHNFLVDLARRNGGQYVYIDTRRFE